MEVQGGGSVSIEKLTDYNFCVWKQKIQLLLALKDVSEYVTDREHPGVPESDEHKQWLRNENKAKAIIGLSLSDEHLEHVRDCETAMDMWETIPNVFERHALLNKLAARRHFYTVTMKSNEKVLAYINRVIQLAGRLKSMKVEIDDKEIAMAVLNGLPARFESLIVAINALGNEDDVVSLDFVKSRFLQDEQRAEMKGNSFASSKDSALMNRAPSTGRTNHCTDYNRSGQTAPYCGDKGINGRRPPPPSNYKLRKNQEQKPAAFVSNEKEEKKNKDDEYTCLMYKIKKGNIPSHSTSWLIDSACTAHMTFSRSLFSEYKSMQSASVEMETKAKTSAVGCGDVVLTLNVNGEPKPCKLKGVLHVPDLGYSLLSVSKMTQNGLKVLFRDEKCAVKQNSKTVATTKLVQKLYVLDVNHQKNSAMLASLQTWHERLAHVHSQGIASMVRTTW